MSDASMQSVSPAAPDVKDGVEPAKKDKIPQPVREAVDRGVDFLNTGHFNKAKADWHTRLAPSVDSCRVWS